MSYSAGILVCFVYLTSGEEDAGWRDSFGFFLMSLLWPIVLGLKLRELEDKDE